MEIIDQTAKVVMLKGEGGDSIKSIDKTSAQGLVDIYTVTLESGKKSTFNVNNGNGIKTIEKTSTSGLVDTYTVTFDNGETTTFNVTNGEKGEKGDKGDTGPQGPQGPKGEKGDPGDGGGIVDTELSTTSTNPVQNKAVTEGINAIQSQIVPTASIEIGDTASKAYNAGDFLVKNGILYKVINAIVKGDALTVGTNIELDTVASELSSISERLSQMSQSEYKIKEYIFELKVTDKWIVYDIDESSVFLDGSSYLYIKGGVYPKGCLIPIGCGDVNCMMFYQNGAPKIRIYTSSGSIGTLHAFVRYK